MKKYMKAFGIWLLLTPIGILNGGFRNYVLEPLLGDIALPLSSITLSILIVIVAYICIPKIGKCESKEYWYIGIMWAVLTNVFDLIIIIMDNRSAKELINMYDMRTGNFWSIVILTTFIAPTLVSKIKNKNMKKV